MPDDATTTLVELASRETGTLRVALLWHQATGLCTVSVNDEATEERFELVVDDNALDTYYHPYAYAALRGVDYRLAA
jgi:hypothetical protein